MADAGAGETALLLALTAASTAYSMSQTPDKPKTPVAPNNPVAPTTDAGNTADAVASSEQRAQAAGGSLLSDPKQNRSQVGDARNNPLSTLLGA